VVAIVNQLCNANESEGGLPIVILSEQEKVCGSQPAVKLGYQKCPENRDACARGCWSHITPCPLPCQQQSSARGDSGSACVSSSSWTRRMLAMMFDAVRRSGWRMSSPGTPYSSAAAASSAGMLAQQASQAPPLQR
jgi:hypothetical protein